MSATGGKNQAGKQTTNQCKEGGRIVRRADWLVLHGYLVGGEALVLQGGRPLGRDAHFHVAERLP